MDMIYWVSGLANSAVELDIPKTATLATTLIAGMFGAYIMATIIRPFGLGFLMNTVFGLIGGCVGAYMFLLQIYNLNPAETSLINFDNDLNLDVLIGLVAGGLAGGFALTFVLGLIKTIIFGRRASA